MQRGMQIEIPYYGQVGTLKVGDKEFKVAIVFVSVEMEEVPPYVFQYRRYRPVFEFVVREIVGE